MSGASPTGGYDEQAMAITFAALSPSERRVAWAVLRSLATVAWWAVLVLGSAWFIRSVDVNAFRLVRAVPTIVTLVAALVLEYHARALRPDRPS